jgi:hypothetical protein
VACGRDLLTTKLGHTTDKASKGEKKRKEKKKKKRKENLPKLMAIKTQQLSWIKLDNLTTKLSSSTRQVVVAPYTYDVVRQVQARDIMCHATEKLGTEEVASATVLWGVLVGVSRHKIDLGKVLSWMEGMGGAYYKYLPYEVVRTYMVDTLWALFGVLSVSSQA